MCLAILVEPGKQLKPEWLDEAARVNDDGFGYAYATGDEVVIRKAVTYEELRTEFWREFYELGADTPFLVHFRLASHGDVCEANSHPFRMEDGGAAIHNGVIDMPGNTKRERSDTQMFIEKIVNNLPDGWADSRTWSTMAARMAGSNNKLAFLWPDGSTILLNWSAPAHEVNGVHFSNRSYEKRTQTTSYSVTRSGTGTGATSHVSKAVESDILSDIMYDDEAYDDYWANWLGLHGYSSDRAIEIVATERQLALIEKPQGQQRDTGREERARAARENRMAGGPRLVVINKGRNRGARFYSLGRRQADVPREVPRGGEDKWLEEFNAKNPNYWA